MTIDLNSSPNVAAEFSNRDFSADFEANGRLTIATSESSLTVALMSLDLAEPYTFLPTNAIEVLAFYNAHTVGVQYAGTFTLTDSGVSNMKHNGNDITAAKYNGNDITAAKYNGVAIF